ncbi:MAG TPA: DUF2953 domain-containing protein [Methanosarcina sp.]|nr:DUF2953 domain-containing protein [Methanosarcina sp.]
MLVITLILLVFLLISFILFTAIGFTFNLKVLSLEEKKEFRGLFTVKWLLFSHTFSIEEPGESLSEEPEKSEKDKTVKEEQSEIDLKKTEKVRVTTETQGKAEVKKEREIKEKEAEEKRIEMGESEEKRIEESESKEERTEWNKKKEKRGIIARIKGEQKPETEAAPETGMTSREKLHWGLEAFRYLRKPLLRLFSDFLNGIKIKHLESYLTFGLSDPADTGMLCGFIHTVAGLAYSRCRHCSFSINPVFMNPMLDFRGNMEIRVRIYSLIFPMLKFMFNRKTLSFTYLIIKEKLWGKRKFNS